MAYTTITDLEERLQPQLLGSEYLLLSDPENSYKATLDTITGLILELSGSSYQELTNKVIDDVTNFVHANAIHFVAKAVQDLPKGTPVKLSANTDTNVVYVDIAGTDDDIIGVSEDGILTGELGEIMVSGILTDVNTSTWQEGDLLYSVNGALTNVKPSTGKLQVVGLVINRAAFGKVLINGYLNDASQITFNNVGTAITANTVQDAIVQVDSRLQNTEVAINDLQEIVFQQATAPTLAEGASDGDIWMDTTTNTLNVYREYPTGTGVYRWEPLLYKWDDTVDGGSW
jgi:predicted RecA/RadA family phage recombinase